MHILLSNDDGYLAPGLRILADHLGRIARLSIVAPERDRSGASNSLTLRHPLRVTQVDPYFQYVDGTPTDCVHLAITGLLESEPDMVVSGINSGANMGDDVLYSGTVAAAMEGRFLGFPAIAVSLVCKGEPLHFETAGRVVIELLQSLLKTHPLPRDTILNINVPDLPFEELQGIEVTRLGHRHKSEPVVKSKDPRGRVIYWVGEAGAEQDAGEGTDFFAVRAGKVSITPLHTDLTQHAVLTQFRSWLGEQN